MAEDATLVGSPDIKDRISNNKTGFEHGNMEMNKDVDLEVILVPVVLGILILLAILTVLCLCYWRKRKIKRNEPDDFQLASVKVDSDEKQKEQQHPLIDGSSEELEKKQILKEKLRREEEENRKLEERLRTEEEKKQILKERLRREEEENWKLEERLRREEEKKQILKERLRREEEENWKLEERLRREEEERLRREEDERLRREEEERLRRKEEEERLRREEEERLRREEEERLRREEEERLQREEEEERLRREEEERLRREEEERLRREEEERLQREEEEERLRREEEERLRREEEEERLRREEEGRLRREEEERLRREEEERLRREEEEERLRRAEKQNPKGYIGLRNQGATCYLNSVLQTLFMTEDFRNNAKRSICQLTKPFDDDIAQLFTDLKSSKRSAATTERITSRLNINVGEQQDAAEYFQKIMNMVNPEMSKVYKGELIHRTMCKNPGKEHPLVTGHESFYIIPICMETYGMDSPINMQSYFDSYFEPIKTCEDDQVKCPTCKELVNTEITCNIHKLPPVLVVQLERFQLHYNYYKKNTSKVEIQLQLSVKDDSGVQHKYDLYAVVKHSGSFHGGHYYAVIKSFENHRWYEFNDSSVRQIPDLKKNFQCEKAFLLLYKKH